jgi:hypothetical protein
MMTDVPQPETTASDRRDPSGRFMPGNPGRPRGARHTALLALDAIGADNAREVLQAVVDAARGGDMRAAEILLSRLWPQRKGRPVALDLPALNTAADVTAALASTAAAMAEGTLSPEEAGAVAVVTESHHRAIETLELEARIAVLEARGTQ